MGKKQFRGNQYVDDPLAGVVAPSAKARRSVGLAASAQAAGSSGTTDYSGQNLRGKGILAAGGAPGRYDGCDVRRSDVLGDCRGDSFRGLKADEACFEGMFVAVDMSDMTARNSRLPKVLENSVVSGDFRGAHSADAASFKGSSISGDWEGAWVTMGQFQEADLSGIRNMDKAHFNKCSYGSGTVFPAGYDPDAHGWVKAELDTGDQARLAAGEPPRAAQERPIVGDRPPVSADDWLNG